MDPIMFDKLTKVLLISSVLFSANIAAKATSVHAQNVLGTSLDVTVYSDNEVKAQQAIEAMLKHINTLEQILSTWQKDSEISLLNDTKASEKLSLHLREVLSACQQWQQRSTGHFSCRLGKLTEQWQSSVKQQTVPDRITLRRLARDIATAPSIELNSSQPVTIASTVHYDIAGIAKGYIIDSSIELLKQQLPNLTGVSLNIGGDIKVWGSKPQQANWTIAVAQHNNGNENQAQQNILVTNGAIAHSGVGERDFVINRRHFNHILDPHEGWPLDTPHSATVHASNAITADAVATAINTMEISSAIAWVDSLSNVEALIHTPQGDVYPSANWHQFSPQRQAKQPSAMTIDYQIPTFNSTDYERPYLSLWLTDSNSKFVRQILLLGDANRWAQENSRWWRRVGRKKPTLLDALARPTRKPGHYQVQWNGFDANNHAVNTTTLVLHMEASREDGGHNYRKIDIDLSKPQQINLPAKGELGKASITLLAH